VFNFYIKFENMYNVLYNNGELKEGK